MSATTVALGDVVTLQAGTGFPPALQGRSDGDFPFAKVGDISRCGRSESSVLFTADHYVDQDDLAQLRAKLVPTGSVLFAKIGEAIRQNHRVVAGRPLLIDNNAMAAIPSNQIDSRFLYHYLKTVDFYALAPATTVPALRKSELEGVRVPSFHIEEQRRIAAILDQAETLRTQRRTALALLDSLTQSLFLDMFGDPVVNPKGWPFTRLDQLVRRDDSINYGVVQPGDALDEGVPLVRVGDVVDGNFDPAALKRIDATIEQGYKRSRLRGDEILVTCVGSIGVVALVEPSMKGFNIARAVSRIPVSEQENRVFLASYLRTDYVQRYFTSELRTVSQPTLNIKQICETRVIQPPLDLQQTFATRIAAIEALKATHRRALAALDALFASLQQRAFAGQL